MKKIIKSILSDKTISFLRDPLRENARKKRYMYREFYQYAQSVSRHIKSPKIIEIGVAQPPDLISDLASELGSTSNWGVNINIANSYVYDGINIEYGDARHLKYEDNSFNILVSLNVFEHIQNFDQALSEFYRILEPGGILIAQFAPIWSSPFGHHLWLNYNNKLFTYENLNVDPFLHLLKSKDEIIARLLITNQSLSENKAERVADYMLFSSDQNQLMLSDYENIIWHSAFEIMSFRRIQSFPHTGTKFLSKMSIQIWNELKKIYPENYEDFFDDGLQILLKK